METKEFRKQIAEQFINSLKENPEHWQRQWSVAGTRPENCVSHTQYRGINRFYLTYVAVHKGSDDMRWATFKQIQQQGWHLRKGAKSVSVEFWQPYDKSTHSPVSWEEYNKAENREAYSLVSRYYQVFNAIDIEGIPPVEKVHNNITQHDAIDKIIRGMEIEVLNDGLDRAYYNATTDEIHLPLKEVFKSDHAYNSTLLHELSHATGAKARLGRSMSGNMYTADYAMEELVAEISSCFAGADIGLTYENADFKNHKAYIQSWINEIEKKPEVLFDAIRQADKAADYLLEQGGLLLENRSTDKLIDTIGDTLETQEHERTVGMEDKIGEYIQLLVKNNDIRSEKVFFECLDSRREALGDLLKWRSLEGAMLNESTPEEYAKACRELLEEFIPEKLKGIEFSKECYEAFKRDVQDNGFQPTARLMSNYYWLMKERGKETPTTLAEISKEYREGSSDQIINNIGSELRQQELQQMETMDQCM